MFEFEVVDVFTFSVGTSQIRLFHVNGIQL